MIRILLFFRTYTGYGPVPNPAVRAGGSMLGYSEGASDIGPGPLPVLYWAYAGY